MIRMLREPSWLRPRHPSPQPWPASSSEAGCGCQCQAPSFGHGKQSQTSHLSSCREPPQGHQWQSSQRFLPGVCSPQGSERAPWGLKPWGQPAWPHTLAQAAAAHCPSAETPGQSWTKGSLSTGTPGPSQGGPLHRHFRHLAQSSFWQFLSFKAQGQLRHTSRRALCHGLPTLARGRGSRT